jgi:hypothetical protein
MNDITKIYEPLSAFLNINVVKTEIVGDTDSTIEEDGVEIIDNQVFLCYNGLFSEPYLIHLTGILESIVNNIKNLKDVNISWAQLITECEHIIDQLIGGLQNKDPRTVKFDITDSDLVNKLNRMLLRIINSLERHKNKLKAIDSETESSVAIESQLNENLDGPNIPLRWNESLNKLVDIFYQLSFEFKNSEKDPLLETSSSNLARFIVTNFTDKEGRPIKASSVQTMLKPNKIDKRPQFNKIILKYTPM